MSDIVERLTALDVVGYQPLTGPIGKEAADTIEALREQVAALMQERDTYKDDYFRRHKDTCDMMDKLIAAQAHVQQLREALVCCYEDCALVNKVVEAALAIPSDTAALNQWGAKLLRGAYEKAECLSDLHDMADELEAAREVMKGRT